MSEYLEEQLVRIAKAVEKIAGKNETSEAEMTQGIHTFYAVSIEEILDKTTEEFSLRRSLRKLVDQAKALSHQ